MDKDGDNKSHYKGGFSQGKMEGFGIFSWKDGSRYEGEYVNNLKHGKGKYINT